MAVKYDKLFSELSKQGMTPQRLIKEANISGNIMTRMRRNQYISLESVEVICKILDCKVEDILDFYG